MHLQLSNIWQECVQLLGWFEQLDLNLSVSWAHLHFAFLKSDPPKTCGVSKCKWGLSSFPANPGQNGNTVLLHEPTKTLKAEE